ncbi:hypothetical protein Hanom_Chr04g00383401 [Helianthus anomalus]
MAEEKNKPKRQYQVWKGSNLQWRSLTRMTGGRKRIYQKNSIEPGGQKYTYPKNFYTKTTYITQLIEKFGGRAPFPPLLSWEALMVCGEDLRTRPTISRGIRFKKNPIRICYFLNSKHIPLSI